MSRTPPRHVCIVLLTAIGDVVNALPLANALRRAWPQVRITWVAEPVPAGMLQPHPAIDQVIVYEKKKGVEGVRALRTRMQREQFDVTLNLMPYFKGVWPTMFSGARERWTYDRARARDFVWLSGTHQLPPRPRAHVLDMFLEFAQALGIEPHPIEWKLVITDEERAQQRALVAQLEGKRGVAIVPTSSSPKKDWPAERYIPVVDAIHDMGARAVLVGGPAPREVQAAELIAQGAKEQPVWMMGDVARSLIWKIDACSLLIGPDTGPVHIARALEKPVIGLYGHTAPARVGPYDAWQELSIDVHSEPGAVSSAADFTPRLGRMELITSAMVIEKLEIGLKADEVPRGDGDGGN